MIKNIVKYKSIVQGKEADFFLDHDTSLDIAEEMAFQFLNYIRHIKAQAKKQQEEVKEEAEKNSDKESNGDQ